MSATGVVISCAVGASVALAAALVGKPSTTQRSRLAFLAAIVTGLAVVFGIVGAIRVASIGGASLDAILLAQVSNYHVTKYTYFAYGWGSAAVVLWSVWVLKRRWSGRRRR
jgi:hypothetical protein